MATARSIHVLLLTDDSANRRRWKKWLQGLPDLVLVDSDASEIGSVDLIITDRTSVADHLPRDEPRLATGEVGVIAVGRPGPADVSLPSDVTRRELELACRLLHEIVRLRRQRRAGRRQEDKLRRLAITDPLTGLPNRRGWDQQLAAWIDDRHTRDVSLCLAVFDLDHFKAINDEHGHDCGDDVLRATGQALHDGVRDGDLVARLGGDEFALALRVTDLDTAQRVVERVRQDVELRLSTSGLPAATASAGFSLATVGNHDAAKKLFDTADTALRRAKKDGRNASAYQVYAAD